MDTNVLKTRGTFGGFAIRWNFTGGGLTANIAGDLGFRLGLDGYTETMPMGPY